MTEEEMIEKVKSLKDQVKERQAEQIRLETKMDSLKKQKEKLINELKEEYDISPDELEEKISSIKAEITAGLEKLENALQS